MFKSGYIAIVGQPNVGKSTLLNALLGQKLAAVSPKPQMTRHRILGIKNVPEAQMLFLDSPGIHMPHRSLNEYMIEEAYSVLNDADVILMMTEPNKQLTDDDRKIYDKAKKNGKPILFLINKVDHADQRNILPYMDQVMRELSPASVIPISAIAGHGLNHVEAEILKHLPEGPVYFPEDQVTDRSERFFASEVIREKIMALTREEVPYSVTVLIEEFLEPKETDRKKIVKIRAAIIIDKDSQKAILVGHGGSMIKKIGQASRVELEKFLEMPVYLDLFVRVEKDWSRDPKKVKEFEGDA
jgi:GTP-binding protein Era